MLLITIGLVLVTVGAVAASDTPNNGISGIVFGLDLGASSLKVAALKSNTSIDIVLNEQSRRKTPTLVGFRKRSRYIGDEALSLAPRFPSLMVPAPHRAAGTDSSATRRVLDNAVPGGALSSTATDRQRGTAGFEFRLPTDAPSPSASMHAPAVAAEEADGRVSPEELTAMLVEYAAGITASDVGEVPAGVVISIPHATPIRQRLALREAAELVPGLKFIGFAHSLSATAVQYGVMRGGFGNATTYLLLADIGASQSQVGLFRFDPPGHRPAAQDSLGTLTTVAVESLAEEGSHAIDLCLAALIDAALVADRGQADSILATPPAGADADFVHKLAQRRFALLRAANSAKEALSVNSAVQYTVEAAAVDGSDFAGSLERSDLDSKCAAGPADRIAALSRRAADAMPADWDRQLAIAAAKAIETASTNATEGTDPTPESDSPATLATPALLFEVTGAGSRVAAVTNALAKAVPEATGGLGRRLNTDDSVALGAAIAATRATAYIRTRGFAVRDMLPCAASIVISVDDPPAGSPTAVASPLTTTARRGLFDACPSLPCVRSASVRISSEGGASRDIADGVSFTIAHAGGACTSDADENAGPAERQTVTVSGIEAAIATALNHTAGISASDLNVTVRIEFTLTADGLVAVASPTVRVSKPKPVKPTPSETPVEAPEGASDDAAETAPVEDAPAAAKKEKKKKKSAKKAGKKKAEAVDKRHVYADLTFTAVPIGSTTSTTLPGFAFAGTPLPMSVDAHAAASSSLAHLAAAEKSARAAALQKNDLETLLLMERDEPRHASNAAAVQLFADIAAWLEGGRGAEEGCTADEFAEQRMALVSALATSEGAAGDRADL